MSRRARGGAGKKPGPDRAAEGEEAKGEGTEPARGGWGETLRSLAVAVVLFLILRTFVVQTFVITSGSMEETLQVGDFLVVNRLAIGSRVPFTSLRIPGYSEPRRGEVLVFDPPHTDEFRLVKRLIGMPGDTLQMRDGVLIVNGVERDEPYVRHLPLEDSSDPWMEWQRDYLAPGVDRSSYRPTRDDWGPLVVPADHYFMLGDNREESLDSRYWGLLEGWRLEGRVAFIYFSYDRDSFAPLPFFTEIRWGRIGDRVR
jgi:signal peptidase I